MKLTFRPLKASEIEARYARKVGTMKALLLYKDARCDMNVLDEAVGVLGWKREHTRDNKNCIVSIWCEDKKQWISKEDTGTESNTEQEKGLASDSFKRACFNFGIGRELYTAPTILVKDNGNKYQRYICTHLKVEENIIKEIQVNEINNGKIAEVVYKAILKENGDWLVKN